MYKRQAFGLCFSAQIIHVLWCCGCTELCRESTVLPVCVGIDLEFVDTCGEQIVNFGVRAGSPFYLQPAVCVGIIEVNMVALGPGDRIPCECQLIVISLYGLQSCRRGQRSSCLLYTSRCG